MRLQRRGFMMMEVLAGLFLLIALSMALAASVGLRAKNAQKLSDQRAALAIAQQTLASGAAPADSPARVSIKQSDKRIGNRQWIEVSVALNGRHITLCGLAPAQGVSK
jgi:Tfp pilus assembly protein PilV